MRRRRLWFRRLTTAVATTAIGALFGFLVPTVITDLSARPAVVESRVNESPLAREFIDAYVGDDQAALDRIGVELDVKQRATRYRTEFKRVDAPIHLGSYVGRGFIVHGYASTVVKNDGTAALLSWRVATVQGKVVVITPPTGIEEP